MKLLRSTCSVVRASRAAGQPNLTSVVAAQNYANTRSGHYLNSILLAFTIKEYVLWNTVIFLQTHNQGLFLTESWDLRAERGTPRRGRVALEGAVKKPSRIRDCWDKGVVCERKQYPPLWGVIDLSTGQINDILQKANGKLSQWPDLVTPAIKWLSLVERQPPWVRPVMIALESPSSTPHSFNWGSSTQQMFQKSKACALSGSPSNIQTAGEKNNYRWEERYVHVVHFTISQHFTKKWRTFAQPWI